MDGRRRGSPALALGAGLLLPGLGHALTGARARGRIVSAAAVAVVVVAVWYALEPGAPASARAWLALAAAPFWIAQALDAAACARGAEPAMLVEDGLHPSGAMYAEWTRLALPTVRGLLATPE